MADSDDLKRRARELCEAATPGRLHVAHDDEGSSIRDGHRRLVARLPYVHNPRDEHDAALFAESRTLIPALLARIETLEAERDELAQTLDSAHLHERIAIGENGDLRARLAKYERIVALAHEWNRLDAHRLGHTGDANCSAGDHDTCEAIPARDALSAALDALDGKDAT